MAYSNPFGTQQRRPRPLYEAMNMMPASMPGQSTGLRPPNPYSAPSSTQPPSPSNYPTSSNATTPQSNAQPGGNYGPGYKGSGEGYLKQFLRQQQQYDQMLRGATGNLAYRANADPYSDLVNQHASEFQGVHDYYDQARSRLYQSLADRGLLNSSALGTGLGTLYGQEGRGVGQLSQGLHQQAHGEQLTAEEELRNLLMQLQGRATGVAEGKASRRMQKKMAEQARQQALLNSLLSGISSRAGQAAAGGAGGGAGASAYGANSNPYVPYGTSSPYGYG